MFFVAHAFSQNLPIEWYQCGANINGHMYDASELMNSSSVYTYQHPDGYDYFLRLCEDFPQEAFPAGYVIQEKFGASGYRINQNDSNDIIPFSYHATQTYSYLDPSDPAKGFVIDSFAPGVTPYDTFHFITKLECDETSSNMSATFSSYEVGHDYIVTMSLKNKWGCPAKENVPSYPEADPVCRYEGHSPHVSPYTIDFYLNKLNQGPHGFPVQIDNDIVAFVKPCGSSKCPPGMTCDADSASTWVCSRPGTCVKFGEKQPNEISPLYEDHDEGIMAKYSFNDKNLTLAFQCDFDLNPGIAVLHQSKYSDSNLYLRGSTSEACYKPVEDHAESTCTRTVVDSHYQLNIELAKYNKVNGYTAEIPESSGLKNSWVNYQPCGPMNCPDFCTESTGASVWLCQRDYKDESYCEDYGLYHEGTYIDSYNLHALSEGVLMTYTGSHGRSSNVHLTCNRTLQAGELVLEDYAQLTSNTLHLRAQSIDVCIATPVPAPIVWTPPMPSPAAVPDKTETDPIIYFTSTTKSIYADLRKFVSNTAARVYNELGQYADFGLYLTPWRKQKCVPGLKCASEEAEGWGCWNNTCYGVILNDYADYRTMYDDGIRVQFRGEQNVYFNLDIRCGFSEGPLQTADSKYTEPEMFTAYYTWRAVCPKNLELPLVPQSVPYPKPLSTLPKVKYSSKSLNFNLAGVKSSPRALLIDMPGSRQEVTIYYEPSGRTECPQYHTCAPADKATAWKCWNRQCFSIADFQYGVSYAESSITYSGGYGGYSTTLNYSCGTTDDIVLEKLATESYNVVTLYGSAKQFCPVTKSTVSLSIGAVFLIAVASLIVLYFGVGSLFMKCFKGYCQVPHIQFWRGVGGSIRTAFQFLTCQNVGLSYGKFSEIDL